MLTTFKYNTKKTLVLKIKIFFWKNNKYRNYIYRIY